MGNHLAVMCCNYLLVILVGVFYHLWFGGLELIDLFVIKDPDKNYSRQKF